MITNNPIRVSIQDLSALVHQGNSSDSIVLFPKVNKSNNLFKNLDIPNHELKILVPCQNDISPFTIKDFDGSKVVYACLGNPRKRYAILSLSKCDLRIGYENNSHNNTINDNGLLSNMISCKAIYAKQQTYPKLNSKYIEEFIPHEQQQELNGRLFINHGTLKPGILTSKVKRWANHFGNKSNSNANAQIPLSESIEWEPGFSSNRLQVKKFEDNDYIDILKFEDIPENENSFLIMNIGDSTEKRTVNLLRSIHFAIYSELFSDKIDPENILIPYYVNLKPSSTSCAAIHGGQVYCPPFLFSEG